MTTDIDADLQKHEMYKLIHAINRLKTTILRLEEAAIAARIDSSRKQATIDSLSAAIGKMKRREKRQS
jgi:septal ring factor EnvC (AmiA/AmiB activator)